MFGRKSDHGKRKGADLMNQLGIGPMTGMPEMEGMAHGDEDDDDEDLEAELAALSGEDYKPPARKAKPQRKAPLPMSEIERMAAAGMQDIDEDVSDTEDPDLLAELQELQGDEDSDNKPSPVKHPSPTKTQSPNLPSPSSHNPPAASRTAPSPSPRPLPSPKSVAPVAASRPTLAMSPTQPKPASAGGTVGILEERITMYKQASAYAKSLGDGSKQRRMDRGLKTLLEQLKYAKAGRPVNEEEIPPPVYTGNNTASAPSASPSSSAASTPSPVAPAAPIGHSAAPAAPTMNTSNTDSARQTLSTRGNQYKKAALLAKKEGDIAKAGNYVRIFKQFEAMIQALDEGKIVDLSQMPPEPPELAGGVHQTPQQPQSSIPVQRSATQGSGRQLNEEQEDEPPQSSLEQAKALFGAPDAPKTAMEALTQRMAKYKESEAAAKTAGEGSKARRMGRIVKQYDDAIKCVKAGRPVDFDELPTPPGFDPIPVGNSPSAEQSQTPKAPAPAPSPVPSPAQRSLAAVPGPAAAASAAAAPRPATAGAVQMSKPAAPQPHAGKAPPVERQNSSRKSTSRIDQQLAFLRERMGEFKEAALKAKKSNDLEMAKKYFRMMKGIEPMAEALECGLPVDLSQVPPSPCDSEEASFIVVNAEDCTPTGDREEVFKTLEEDLIRQIRICVTNAQHYQKLGDVPTTAKFQKLEQHSRKDLESVKSAYRHGDPAPKFHYEVRTFSIVQSNTDLGDADLEVTIERGIQFNLPSGYAEKDMDTCVKYELAYPNENPQSGSTGTIKDTINPEYKETFKLEINRASKAFFRFVDRKALKLEVYLKRGFFKGDKLLGTVNVKLQPLESKCTVHDSYDLMDGRKTAGGKLEVKIRVRDPFKSKQVEEVKEKWLVIDQFIRTLASMGQMSSKQAPKPESVGTVCMEVLRFEKQTLDKQIAHLKDSLSVSQTQNLRQKSSLIQEKIELQQKKLREGGGEAWRAYLASVEREAVELSQEARQYAKLGETKKAELYLTKKKYAEKEIAAIRAKMSSAH